MSVLRGDPNARSGSRRGFRVAIFVFSAWVGGCTEPRPAAPPDAGVRGPVPGGLPSARVIRAAPRGELADLLAALETKAPTLARRIWKKLETFDGYRKQWNLTAPLVVGRVRLTAEPTKGGLPAFDPPLRVEEVDAPMEILDDGYFVAALGHFDRPIQLRLPGYEPVDVDVEGLRGGPSRVYIGELPMAPAPERTLATLRGKVRLPPGYSRDDVDVHLTVGPDLVNSPNGWREQRVEENMPPLIDAPFDDEGRFEVVGLAPFEYKLWLVGLDIATSTLAVVLRPGERRDVGVLTLETKRTVHLTYAMTDVSSAKLPSAATLEASLQDGETWSLPASPAQQASRPIFQVQQKSGKFFTRSNEEGCRLVDLGPGSLAALLGKPAPSGGSGCNLPLVSGHVYALQHREAGLSVLFRVEVTDDAPLCDTLLPSSGPNALRWSPPEGRPLPPEVQTRNATFHEPKGPAWRWINVWASWCGPCIEEMPLLERWRKTLTEQGHAIVFEMWSIDEDLPGLISAQKRGLPGPVRWAQGGDESAIVKALGLQGGQGIPVHGLVDTAGMVRCVRRGEVDERGFLALLRLLRNP